MINHVSLRKQPALTSIKLLQGITICPTMFNVFNKCLGNLILNLSARFLFDPNSSEDST